MRISDWSSDVCSSDPQRFGREMLRVLDRLVQERLLLREPGVGPVRELAVEFVLTLIDRETGIEPEPAGDEIVDEGRPFRIAGLLVEDGEFGIAAVARRTRPARKITPRNSSH